MTPEQIVYATLIGAAWCILAGIFVGYRVGVLNERERTRAGLAHNKPLPADHPFNAPPRPVVVRTEYGEIPADVVIAASMVGDWFKRQNITDRKLGDIMARTEPTMTPVSDGEMLAAVADAWSKCQNAGTECHARQQSSSMVCVPCGLQWDVNDPAPPRCVTWTPNERPGAPPADLMPRDVVAVRLPCGMTLTGEVAAFDWQRNEWEGDVVAWRRADAGRGDA